MALSNSKAFFDAVRQELFAGNLNLGQVKGLEAILAAWDVTPKPDVRFVSYSMATAYLETDKKMLPIKEYGLGHGRPYGKTVPPWNQAYYGRGLVQLTWLRNYATADARLRARGLLASGEDLVKAPDLALRPDIAAAIMTSGMTEGWFTGKKLADFFSGEKIDAPVQARMIINGTDRAGEIAGFHAHFLTALKAGGF